MKNGLFLCDNIMLCRHKLYKFEILTEKEVMAISHKRVMNCPAPSKIRLQRRLSKITGITPVTVLIPGRTIRGTIRAVNPSAFKINRTMIPFASPFAIDQGFFEQEASRIEVLVKIKRIRKFNGFLVRRGLDFIEFEQDLPEDIARWIIPLNRFTRVICGDAKVEE